MDKLADMYGVYSYDPASTLRLTEVRATLDDSTWNSRGEVEIGGLSAINQCT